MIQIEFYDHSGSSIYTLQGVEGIPGIVDKKRFLLEKGKEPIDYLKFYGITNDNIVSINYSIPPQKPKHRMVFYELTGDESSINRLTIATDPVMEDHGVLYMVPELDDFFKKEMSDLMICRTTHSLADIHPDISNVILSWNSNHIKWLCNIPWKPEYLGRYYGGIELNTNRLKELISRGLVLRPCEPNDRVKVNIPTHGKYSEYSLSVKEYMDGIKLRKGIKGLIPFLPANGKNLETKSMKEFKIKKFQHVPIRVERKNEGKIPRKSRSYFLVNAYLSDIGLMRLHNLELAKKLKRECPNLVEIVLTAKDTADANIKVCKWLGVTGKSVDIFIKSITTHPVYCIRPTEATEISEKEYFLEYRRQKFNSEGIPVLDLTNPRLYEENLIARPSTKIHKVSLRGNPTKKQRENRKWHEKHRTKKYYVKEDSTDRKVCLIKKTFTENQQTGRKLLSNIEVVRVLISDTYDHDSPYSKEKGWSFCPKSVWKKLRNTTAAVEHVPAKQKAKEEAKASKEKYYGKRAFKSLQRTQRSMRVGLKAFETHTRIAAERAAKGDLYGEFIPEPETKQSKGKKNGKRIQRISKKIKS